MFKSLAFLLPLLACSNLFAHGAVHSSIIASLKPDSAVVEIKLAMFDLMRATGHDFREDYESERIDPSERRQLAIEWQPEVESCFRIFGPDGTLIPAKSIWTSLPDFDSVRSRNLGLAQQTIEVTLVYEYAPQPETLTFWSDFGKDHHGYEALASLTIKREGEMVMLPANIGPALPLRWAVNWDQSPEPVAKLESLSSVSAIWLHRMIAGQESKDHEIVRCRYLMPLPLLAQSIDLRPEALNSHDASARELVTQLRKKLSDAVRLDTGNAKITADRSYVSVHSLSSTRLRGDTFEAPPTFKDAIVNLELEFRLEREATVEPQVDFSELFPVSSWILVTHVSLEGEQLAPTKIRTERDSSLAISSTSFPNEIPKRKPIEPENDLR